jgi:hypothetical protein
MLATEITVIDKRGFTVILRPTWNGDVISNVQQLEALLRALIEREFRPEPKLGDNYIRGAE